MFIRFIVSLRVCVDCSARLERQQCLSNTFLPSTNLLVLYLLLVGYVIVCDMIMEPEATPAQALMDLNMLVMCNGKERNLDQFNELFTKSGLVFEKAVPTPTQMSCIIARKA